MTHGRVLSINSSELVTKLKLFLIFRSSSTIRSVSCTSSHVRRKSNVIADEIPRAVF